MDASTLHPECTLGRQTPVCRQLGHEAAFRADQGLRTRHGHRRLGNVVLSASLSGGRQWPTTVCCGHLSQMDTPLGKIYARDSAVRIRGNSVPRRERLVAQPVGVVRPVRAAGRVVERHQRRPVRRHRALCEGVFAGQKEEGREDEDGALAPVVGVERVLESREDGPQDRWQHGEKDKECPSAR